MPAHASMRPALPSRLALEAQCRRPRMRLRYEQTCAVLLSKYPVRSSRVVGDGSNMGRSYPVMFGAGNLFHGNELDV